MSDFSLIDYTESIRRFEAEEKAGHRYKMGDLKTSLWLKQNKINFGEVKKISNELPDPRLFIIGEGELSGFYIYSNLLQICYKNILVGEKILIESP